MTELVTRRLTIRTSEESDTDLLSRLQLREEVKTYIGQFRLAPKGTLPFTIVRKGVRLGHVALVPRRDSVGDYDLVCALLPEAEGCGIATEACERILAWANQDLGLKEIFASVQRENSSSTSLAARLGMSESSTKSTTRERLYVKVFAPAT